MIEKIRGGFLEMERAINIREVNHPNVVMSLFNPDKCMYGGMWIKKESSRRKSVEYKTLLV